MTRLFNAYDVSYVSDSYVSTSYASESYVSTSYVYAFHLEEDLLGRAYHSNYGDASIGNGFTHTILQLQNRNRKPARIYRKSESLDLINMVLEGDNHVGLEFANPLWVEGKRNRANFGRVWSKIAAI
jgi:hypothetical protein